MANFFVCKIFLFIYFPLLVNIVFCIGAGFVVGSVEAEMSLLTIYNVHCGLNRK